MAKILLADDNSNVHKTVALALAALGIEVNSVNNGDAAIKKLSDFTPDLILADIFMPVRSGYEVCEYVKKNPRFAQVPVILLVGAFDPLDEREAQRVGADGILKKPFVPPDPLITMVKTLLHRIIGERPGETTVKEPVPVLAIAGKAAGDESDASLTQEDSDPSANEFPSPMGRADYSETHLPAAFSQLLEAARYATSPEGIKSDPTEHDQVLTSPRDATLGEPIFWKSDADGEGSSQESLEPASEIEIPVWTQSVDAHANAGENDEIQPVEPLEFVSEECDQTSASIVDSEPLQLDLAAQTSLTVEPSPAEDLAANPTEWLASAPHEPGQSDAAGTESVGPDAVTNASAEEPSMAATSGSVIAETAPVPVAQAAEPEEIAPLQALAPEEFTSPASPDQFQVEPSLDEQETPAIQAVEPPSHAAQRVEVPVSTKKMGPNDTLPSVALQWSELTASISERANELVARPGLSTSAQVEQILSAGLSGPIPASANPTRATSLDSGPVELHSSESRDLAKDSSVAAPGPTQASGPDPALVEAVVQKVISKMSPQVVDIITREFLRPIVQALVHRAIEK